MPAPPRPLDVDTVFLDVGGVLLLPEHRTIGRAFATVGARAESRLLDAAHYTALAEAESADGPAPPIDYWVAYARAAGLPRALVEPAAAAVRRVQDTRPLFTRPLPGCRAGLRALAATGVRVALVSNTEHGHIEATLRRLGVCQVGPGRGVLLAAAVDSHVVGVAKPDPAIFELALQRAGAERSRTAHVGDSLRIDVAGAVAAGLIPIHLDPHRLCPRDDHRHVISLVALAAVIDGQGREPVG
jgi:putative hydrolase of the HAD superfamily